MNQYCIYIARLLSACCFFIFLTTANTWMDTLNNSILVFGYRFFILLAPLFLILTKRWITFIAFFISMIGMACWFKNEMLLGTILFSMGISIGGFVLKYYTSKTSEGIAGNRIALNVGGFLSGIVILFPANYQLFLWVGIGLMLITLICSIFIGKEEKNENETQKINFSFVKLMSLRGIAWSVVGIVAGIRFAAVISILPQYLIDYYGSLPNWYGFMISLDTLMVIFFQSYITRFMKHFDLNQSLFTLLFSMIIVAVPGIFFCQTILGAMIWTMIIVILECAISYLDLFSREEGTLLIKEFFMAIGLTATVFFVRSFDVISAIFFIGLIGFLGMLFVMKILGPVEDKKEEAVTVM